MIEVLAMFHCCNRLIDTKSSYFDFKLLKSLIDINITQNQIDIPFRNYMHMPLMSMHSVVNNVSRYNVVCLGFILIPFLSFKIFA